MRGQDVSSEHKSLDNNDVERNADFYTYAVHFKNHEVAQIQYIDYATVWLKQR